MLDKILLIFGGIVALTVTASLGKWTYCKSLDVLSAVQGVHPLEAIGGGMALFTSTALLVLWLVPQVFPKWQKLADKHLYVVMICGNLIVAGILTGVSFLYSGQHGATSHIEKCRVDPVEQERSEEQRSDWTPR